MSGRPAFVYRCFDASGRLLYVGCTYDVKRRMQEHRNDPRTTASHVLNACMDRVESRAFPSRKDALNAEAKAIRRERPLLNMQQTGAPMYVQWRHVADYLQAAGIPIERARLARCSGCDGVGPTYLVRSGRCPACDYMLSHGIQWGAA